MQCPHCDQTVTEQTCPHCNAGLLDNGPYCSYCGKRRTETPGAEDKLKLHKDGDDVADVDVDDVASDDWDQRVLCSDGDCIGVIGPDGRCKECGKPYQEGPQE